MPDQPNKAGKFRSIPNLSGAVPLESQPLVKKAHGTIASGTGDTSVAPGGPVDDGMSSASSVSIPEEFGRYKIIRSLGEGAMGVVFLAEDTQLQRQVALKIPQFDDSKTGARLERFYREARLAATLNHPNICPIFDVGEFEGTHFISMAYIQGKPLSASLKPGKPLSERTAASLVRKVALALQEAHAHHVIHRDLKPANIMIDQRGEPIIMDFGLARQLNSPEQSQITHNGAIIGTPSYMSPEQVQGRTDTVGAASDIYGLGVILYQLLTGRLPFQGPVVSVLAQIATQTPALPSSFRDRLSPELEAICLQAMAKRPSDRFASMAEFASALKSYLRNDSSHAPAPGASAAASASLIQAPDLRKENAKSTRIHEITEWCRRRSPALRWTVAVGSGVIVMALAVLSLSRDTTPGATLWGRNADSGNSSTQADGTADALAADDQSSGMRVAPLSSQQRTDPAGSVAGENTDRQVVLVPAKPFRRAMIVDGSWHIDGDELVQSGGWGGVIQFGDPLWQDYDFSFEVVKIEGPYGAAGRFRFFDSNNSMEFDLGAGGNKIYGLAARVPSNARFNATKQNVSMVQDHKYRMLIKARQDHFACYLDDEFIFSCQEDRLTHGAVGFTTCQTTARFSQIKVTAPDGTELWTGLPDLPEASGTD